MAGSYFSSLQSLTHLNLSKNKLIDIEQDAFSTLKNLIELDLHQN